MKESEDVYTSYSDARLKQVFGLLSLYYATKDSSIAWSKAPAWQLDFDECNWEGVVCNESDEVVEIDLANFGLDGVIPPEVVLVESAQVMRLDDNPGLTGNIPGFLGRMNLRKYDIDDKCCGLLFYRRVRPKQRSHLFVKQHRLLWNRYSHPL